MTCQCDWSTDGFGYQNVKDNSPGFLEWNLVYGPLPEGELGPKSGFKGGNCILALFSNEYDQYIGGSTNHFNIYTRLGSGKKYYHPRFKSCVLTNQC